MDGPTFIDTVRRGDEGSARKALGADPSLARARDASGVSVVCLAVYAGRLELAREMAQRRDDLDVFESTCMGDEQRVRALLDSGAASVDSFSPDGFTPLGFAAFFGHLELLKRLIASGADVNAPARNAMRVRPLHSAAAHIDQTKAAALAEPLLAAGAEPNAQQRGGFAPLHEAALNGNAALTALLLAHGADPQQRNDEGRTPLDLAREKGHAGLFASS